MKFDVFISYKRDGGSVWAELIRAILVHKYHLNVFLDVETLQGGEWPPQLDDGIRESCNIIMVLTEGLEKKIKLDEDVFVQEIMHAREYGKPIIPFYALGCGLSNIIESKEIPSIIKDVVSEQHSIVEYNHGNREITYDLLRKQLNCRLKLTVKSLGDSCLITYRKNEELEENREIEKDEKITINIDRDFVGDFYIDVFGKDSDFQISYLYCIGKKKDKSSPFGVKAFEWPLQGKEDKLDAELMVNWRKEKVARAQCDRLTNPTFRSMDAIGNNFKFSK